MKAEARALANPKRAAGHPPGVFCSIADLQAAINAYRVEDNASPNRSCGPNPPYHSG
jgi:hypothetical protein